jgi:large subunit ribosomal protein L31
VLLKLAGEVLMRKGVHPEMFQTVFKDVSADFSFLTTTTLKSNETITWGDRKTYPLIKIDISSASHPFYTKQTRTMDTEGRVEKFKKKYANFYNKDAKVEKKT